MKLIYEELEGVLSWQSQEIPIIAIKNIRYRNNFIQKAFKQSNIVSDSPIYISDDSPNNKEMKFETIINIFELDVNSNIFMNKVKRVFEDLILEDVFLLSEITSEIYTYIYNKSITLPVSVELENELNVKRLLQLFEIKIVEESQTLLEKLMNYLQVNTQLGICTVFIVTNLKQYLTNDELVELYKMINYEELTLILVENELSEPIDGEKHFLIDEDLCLIY